MRSYAYYLNNCLESGHRIFGSLNFISMPEILLHQHPKRKVWKNKQIRSRHTEKVNFLFNILVFSVKMSSAAMEHFVMNVRTLSAQGNFNELNEFLQKNMEILVRNPAHLGTVLETLDVQQHSLGVLAVSYSIFHSWICFWHFCFF